MPSLFPSSFYHPTLTVGTHNPWRNLKGRGHCGVKTPSAFCRSVCQTGRSQSNAAGGRRTQPANAAYRALLGSLCPAQSPKKGFSDVWFSPPGCASEHLWSRIPAPRAPGYSQQADPSLQQTLVSPPAKDCEDKYWPLACTINSTQLPWWIQEA